MIIPGEEMKFALVAFSAVFFVVDPIVAVPLFLAITARCTEAERRVVAARASLATLFTLSFFAAAGGVIFKLFGMMFTLFTIILEFRGQKRLSPEKAYSAGNGLLVISNRPWNKASFVSTFRW